MPKIETKVRTFDEGLSICQEVTKVITHEDGSIETKVEVFEIGRRSNHSDYWRAQYADEDIPPIEKVTKEDYLLSKCMHDVARIANAFNSDIKLAYKSAQSPSNNPEENVVLLDPNTAISEEKLGQKIDVFSGEILLGTALRKQSEDTKAAYVKHIRQAYHKDAPMVDRASSLLYLAMEADAACEHIKDEAPGFTEYAHSRARKYVSETGSGILQDEFCKDTPSPGHKFAALIREFDTFGSQPLDYGKFGPVVDNVVEQVRSLPDAESRLAAARQLAHRYLIQMDGELDMPEPEGGGEEGQEAEGKGNPTGGKGSPGKVDMELLEEMLSSADMLGKDGDPDEFDSVDGNGSGWNKPQSPSDIMKQKNFDGNVDKIPVKLEINVASRLDDYQAARLYALDSIDVRPISEAIEESLQILNNEQVCWDEYSLRSGEIDAGSFHKLIDDSSDDVFYQVETLPKMKIQVGLVLDESGSMGCYITDKNGDVAIDQALTTFVGKNPRALNRSGAARKLATAFVEGTKNISGVSLNVYGHAGPHPVCRVYRYLNESTPESQFHRVSHITNRLHNYDGYAILKAGEDMMENEDQYDRQIMFIISDGEPSVTSYTGEEAQKHIASVVGHLNECGMETYAIGVDNAFPAEAGDMMYGEDRCIILPNFDLSEVSTIISAFLEEISKG